MALQAEQSLGLGIMPFFNKHSISLTRFIQIMPKKFPRPGSRLPPPVLVLHTRYAILHICTAAHLQCCTFATPYLVFLVLMCSLPALLVPVFTVGSLRLTLHFWKLACSWGIWSDYSEQALMSHTACFSRKVLDAAVPV